MDIICDAKMGKEFWSNQLGKYLRRDKPKFKKGDLVTIEECRPLSKTKSWKLIRVEQKAKKID